LYAASTMLQRHALRQIRHAAGRSRLPLAALPSAHPQVRALATASSHQDLFANGTNAYYAEEMYRHWKEDPKSVHPSWDAYFSGLDKGLGGAAFQAPPGLASAPVDGVPALFPESGSQLDDHLKVCS